MTRALVLFTAAILGAAPPGAAQSAADLIVLGDREHAAMNAQGALMHYQSAIQTEQGNAEALWRAASEATDLGEFNENARDSLYALAEDYGKRAVQADAMSSMAHFALAKALGRRAQSLGPRDRVRYAEVVRTEAIKALLLDSLNAGALHVMGLWHAEIMRLSGIERFLARKVLGGKMLSEANWNEATRLLERATALEPHKIVHHRALAEVYADRGMRDKARGVCSTALGLKPIESNDLEYRRLVEARLAALR